MGGRWAGGGWVGGLVGGWVGGCLGDWVGGSVGGLFHFVSLWEVEIYLGNKFCRNPSDVIKIEAYLHFSTISSYFVFAPQRGSAGSRGAGAPLKQVSRVFKLLPK